MNTDIHEVRLCNTTDEQHSVCNLKGIYWVLRSPWLQHQSQKRWTRRVKMVPWWCYRDKGPNRTHADIGHKITSEFEHARTHTISLYLSLPSPHTQPYTYWLPFSTLHTTYIRAKEQVEWEVLQRRINTIKQTYNYNIENITFVCSTISRKCSEIHKFPRAFYVNKILDYLII